MSDTQYFDYLWFGSVSVVRDTTSDLLDVRIREADGGAYASIRSATPLEIPAGLMPFGPELGRILNGEYMGDAQPIPKKVTLRQFLKGGAQMEIFTKEEALAAGKTGTVPAFMEAIFSKMPEEDAWSARMDWTTMTEVDRNNPLVIMFGQLKQLSPEQMDQLFLEWSRL